MTRYLPILLLFVAGCSEPFIVFAGGKLAGDVASPPADWDALDDEETFQLEVRPEDPYSVNIWAVGIGEDLYIGTGPDGTRWSAMIEEAPQVRLRVGATVYPLLAHAVDAVPERRRVAAAYADKYDLDQEENWLEEAKVYRLDRP